MPQQPSLVRRLFLTFAVLSTAVALVVFFVSAALFQLSAVEDAHVLLSEEATLVSSALGDASSDAEAKLAGLEMRDTRVTLIEPDGTVSFDSDAEADDMPSHADRPEFEEARKDGSASVERPSETMGYVSIYQATRLADGSVLRLSVDRAGVVAMIFNEALLLLLVDVVLIISSLIAAHVLARRLVAPILKLDPAHPDASQSYAEIAPLVNKISSQQELLAQQVEELKGADAMRREFTANVTHELKTPLASISGAAELIKSGTTSFADMYFHQWMTARACRETGMRAFISQTLFGDLEETKKRLSETRLDREIDNELLRKDYAVHAVYTCTKETYEYTAAAARERKAVVNTHLSETKKEMDDCIRQTGMLPAVYLEKTGFFDVPCYAAHGVWLQEEETEILRCHDVGIVHNPSSNCKLASGIAPVSRFRSAGLTVGLGTDGASSNNNLSMLKEMRLAAMISAVSTMNVGALRPYDIIRMATLDSAKVLKADHLIGSLEKGKKADITIINPDSANMTPMNDIFSAIVFSADERNIDSVYVNGKCLFCEGKLTTIDEDAVIHEALKRWDILRKEG